MEKIKVLILGTNGMLGHVVHQTMLKIPTFLVYSSSRLFNELDNHYQLDLQDLESIEQCLDQIRPKFVINCAGILVNKSDTNLVDAFKINSVLPNFLQFQCDLIGCKLIHISTDCVFSGRKGYYLEMDIPDPIDIYGKSKAIGEKCISHNVLILRTSIIGLEISNHKTGLLNWIIANKSARVSGYKNVLWNGVFTTELARVICNLVLEQSEQNGIIHVTGETISKYDLIKIVNDVLNLDIEITEDISVIKNRTLDISKPASITIPSNFRSRLVNFLEDYGTD